MKRKGIFVGFLFMGLQFSNNAIAQAGSAPLSSAQMGIDYNKSVRPHGDIEPLGNDLFGDSTNLYTGETQFSQTDIDLPGNNALTVRFSRRLLTERDNYTTVLGDWEVDLPYIGGTYSKQDGWITWVSGAPNNRCSVPLDAPMSAGPAPSVVKVPAYNVQWSFDPRFIWHGNTLHLPGQSNQEMLVISPSTLHPSGSDSYRWITPNYWEFSCLASVANGGAGESFLARAPDGLKYWFNWMASKPAGTLSASWGNSGANFYAELPLLEFRAYPTRIEDRFGNYVILTYDSANPWQLKSISSNDGRVITVDYVDGRVSQVKANGRTWTYAYTSEASPRLQNVGLPDGSHWQFDEHSFGRDTLTGWLNCADYRPPEATFGDTATVMTTTMVHPSGATGTFQFRRRSHGRTNGPHVCVTVGNSSIPMESHFLSVVSIYRKQISGAGLASSSSWDFSYSPLTASVAGTTLYQQCASSPCSTERTLKVTKEDGTWHLYRFNQDYAGLEGKLLSEQVGGSGNSLLRNEVLQYQTAPQGDYSKIGTNPCYSCNKAGEIPVPLKDRSISQDGGVFTMHINSFDSMARPVSITRSSVP